MIPSNGATILRVGHQRLKLVNVSLCLEVFTLRYINVLTRNQTRVAFPDLFEALVGQSLNIKTGLGSRNPLLQFGHFNRGEHLSFLYPVTLID